MTTMTLAAAALAWLLTPFLSGALVACSDWSRAAVASHLPPCATAGWLSRAGLAWGATSLEAGPGEVVFVLCGPLGGLIIWARSSGDNGPGDDPPDDDDGGPLEWDWDRFERELADYEATIRVRGQPGS